MWSRSLSQIDVCENPTVYKGDALSLSFSVYWAANYLAGNMAKLAQNFPNLNPAQLLQATAASYNLGVGGISGNPKTIDVGTRGGNYGSTVLGLMDCFR